MDAVSMANPVTPSTHLFRSNFDVRLDAQALYLQITMQLVQRRSVMSLWLLVEAETNRHTEETLGFVWQLCKRKFIMSLFLTK